LPLDAPTTGQLVEPSVPGNFSITEQPTTRMPEHEPARREPR